MTFLQGILEYPLVGMSQRYKRLGVSTRHGNEHKERLLRAGLVRVAEIVTPTGRTKLLELTSEGEQFLRDRRLLSGPRLHNGAAHRYWKERVAEHFRRLGYTVTIEKTVVDGKRVDVEAVKGDERIAIEVETSQAKSTSDFALVLAYYRKLVVFSTDAAARTKVEAALSHLSLGDRARVECWMPGDLRETQATATLT